MAQLAIAVVSTVALVLFSMANTHHVELSYVFGKPVTVRLIFLLGIAFLTGCSATLFVQLISRVSQQAELRRQRRWSDVVAAGEVDDD